MSKRTLETLSGYAVAALTAGAVMIFAIGCQPRTTDMPHWHEPTFEVEPAPRQPATTPPAREMPAEPQRPVAPQPVEPAPPTVPEREETELPEMPDVDRPERQAEPETLQVPEDIEIRELPELD